MNNSALFRVYKGVHLEASFKLPGHHHHLCPPLGRASRRMCGQTGPLSGGQGATAQLLGASASRGCLPTGPLPGARDPSACLLGPQLGGWVLGSNGGGQGALELTFPLATSGLMTTRIWIPTGQVTFQVPRGWWGKDGPSAPRMAAALGRRGTLGHSANVLSLNPPPSCPMEGLPVSWAWGEGGPMGAQETLGVQSRRESGQSPLPAVSFLRLDSQPPVDGPAPPPPAVPLPLHPGLAPHRCPRGRVRVHRVRKSREETC